MNVQEFLKTKRLDTDSEIIIKIKRNELEELIKEYAYIISDEQRAVCADNLPDPDVRLYACIINCERPRI